MQRVVIVTLILGTIAFDLFVLWGVSFTFAWGGNPSLHDLGFWLFVASPVVATVYCIRKVLSFRRGERPHV